MKKRLTLSGLTLLAVVLAVSFAPAQPVPTKDDDLSAKADKLFAKWDKKDSPGCALMVLKDGKPVHQRAYGMANVELGVPITLSTVFLIASLSKHFAVFCIMLLVHGGRLSLDDDVRKHVPEVPNFGKTITVRHLIHHTSGLREYLPLMSYAGWRSGDAITERDLLDVVSKQKELNFEPGAEYLYCNTGYELLGLIVKRVSGKSLRQFARENIFEPLGMKDTQFRDDHRMLFKGFAASYAPKAGGWQYAPVFHGLAGASNLHTTVEDLARWDQNFYDMKVGGKEVLALMHEQFKLNNGKEIDYAGGLHISKYKGLTTVDHTGSHGGFRTILLRFPDQHFSVILLANAADVNTTAQARKVADLYLADQLKASKKDGQTPKVIKDDPKSTDHYLGDYIVNDAFVVSITREDGKLMVQTPLLKRELFVLSATEFWEKDNNWRFVFSETDVKSGPKLTVHVSGDELSGKRTQKFAPTAEQLKEFTGTFYSEELEVMYTLLVRDGKLVVRHRKGEIVMQPLQPDGFKGDFGEYGGAIQLRFTRDAGHEVGGFLLTSGRVRNLRFVRAAVTIKA
jgi:CubicO group peptidase (beta-lactamase class C family)